VSEHPDSYRSESPGAIDFAGLVRRVKLVAPVALPDAVPLAGVADRLAQAARYPVTLVTAPAGFGKTTQLALWQRTVSDAGWIFLSPEDDDPAQLFRLLAAALARLDPLLAHGLAPLLASDIDDPQRLGESLADLLADLEDDLILILDDLHDLANPRTLALLDHLLRTPPPNLHLVLAGRTEPSIPALDRLAQRGCVLRIDERRLRFTSSDTLRLLPKGISDREQVAAAITLRAEGWPAAVRAFATMQQSADEEHRRTGDAPASLRRFVAGEVLARQPVAAVDLLRATAVLSHVTPDLAAAIHGGTPGIDARRLLDGLVAAHAFIAPDERGGYRVHAVVRDTLQEHLGAAAVAAQHAAAAEWFARRGEVPEAITHAFAAGNEVAADLIERHVFTWFLRTHLGEINAAIGRLPEEMVESRPALLLALTNTLIARGLGEQARQVAARAETLLDDRERTDPDDEDVRRLRAEAVALRCSAAQYTGRVAESIDLARLVMDAPEATIKTRSDALAAWAFGVIELGRLDEAERTLTELAADTPEAKLRTTALVMLTAIAIERLDPVQVETYGRFLVNEAERHGFGRDLAWGHFGLAFAAYQRSDLATASIHASAGWDVAAGNYIVASQQLAILQAQIAAAGDRVADALAVAEADLRGLQLAGALPLLPIAAALRARYAAASGDFTDLDRPLPPGTLDARLSVSQPTGSAAAFRAAALLARSHPGDAVRAVDLLERFLESPAAQRTWRRAEALPLLAAAHEAAGHRAPALAVMAEAHAQEPGRMIRRFADAGPFALDVLDALAISDDPMAERASRVLAAISPPTAASAVGAMAMLTERQRDILDLMAIWLTNKEIADRLAITPDTVRQHTRAIYRKLDVPGRREAVAALRRGAAAPKA
jgi:LuxR family transcriptional regulator, maltose regulon positive regulatory protein